MIEMLLLIVYVAVALFSLGAMLAGEPFNEFVNEKSPYLGLLVCVIGALIWPLVYVVLFVRATRVAQ